MAADIVSGLFGLSPGQIQQQQLAGDDAAAMQYAKLDPFQKANYSLGMGARGLTRTGAGMLGMQRPEEIEAQNRTAAMTDLNLQDPRAILERAAQTQDPRIRMQLQLLAQQRQKELDEAARQQQTAALALRKQDFQETEAMQLKRDQLAQQFEIAKMRSEDSRIAAADRAAAAREANAIRLQIAQMGLDAKMAGGVTPAQQAKLKAAAAKSSGAIRGMENGLATLMSEAETIKNSKGLAGATGAMGMLPSYPGGEAAQVESKLNGFKSRVKEIGLQLIRQGGGIGAITEKEWGIIEGMVADIDPVKLGAQGTKDAIDRVLAKAQSTVDAAKMQHQESFDSSVAPAPAAPPPPSPSATPAAATGGWAIRPK